MKSGTPPKVLYIAGYGRSGSTILDVLLGAHERAVSVGELVFLGDDWHRDRTCACGAPYSQCPFWKDAFENEEHVRCLIETQRAVETRRTLFQLCAGMLSDQVCCRYRHRMRRLFTYIAEESGADIVVDSSKSARKAVGRFWALRKVAELDVRVIHLVRDGREVLSSFAEKGSNWALEGYQEERSFPVERALVGWILANSTAGLLGRSLGKERYLRVRFEDLLKAPSLVLRRIGRFADLDMSSVAERVANDKPFAVGHNVGGNRIRHNQAIRLRCRPDADRQPWARLSTYHQGLFGVLGLWLNSSLGYD